MRANCCPCSKQENRKPDVFFPVHAQKNVEKSKFFAFEIIFFEEMKGASE